MDKIKFDTVNLIDDLVQHKNIYLKCIEENNSISSTNYKCLVFCVELENQSFKARIYVQEEEKNISLEVLLENVCKNIDVSDEKMDAIIQGLKEYVQIVYSKLMDCKCVRNKLDDTNGLITYDTILTDLENSQCNLSEDIVTVIQQLYQRLKPTELEVNNYINEIILFGNKGREVAQVIKQLEIGEYRRTRSGYLINFFDENTSYSNTFSQGFASKLSEMGVPVIAVPLDILEYQW